LEAAGAAAGAAAVDSAGAGAVVSPAVVAAGVSDGVVLISVGSGRCALKPSTSARTTTATTTIPIQMFRFNGPLPQRYFVNNGKPPGIRSILIDIID
jgi:hypothetical protein